MDKKTNEKICLMLADICNDLSKFSKDKKQNESFKIRANIFKDLSKIPEKTHKSHIRFRQTVCGIRYDDVDDMIEFFNNNLVGHWRKVNCIKCINKKLQYNESLKTGEI